MTAPEPFDSLPGRLGVPGRRGDVPRGRATLRTFVVEPVESPLRRLLRTTAARVEFDPPTVEKAGPPARWRRPERHAEPHEPFSETISPEAAETAAAEPTTTSAEPMTAAVEPMTAAAGPMTAAVGPTTEVRVDRPAEPSPVARKPESIAPHAEVAGQPSSVASDQETSDPPTVTDEELPPVLRAVLAARAAAKVTAPEDAPVADAPVTDTPVAHDVAEPSQPEASAPQAPPARRVRTRAKVVVETRPNLAAAPPAAPPTAASSTPPVPVDTAPLVASLPFARVAAVACAEGEPEPPICHPATSVVSRVRPLSPLRALARHGRRVRRAPFVLGVAAASVLVAVLATAATAAWAPPPAPVAAAKQAQAGLAVTVTQDPPPVVSLDEPAAAAVAVVATCDIPTVQTALAAADPTGVIAAAGGAQAFHDAIVGGTAPCLSLGDSAWPWVVVNKQRLNSPVDFAPASVVVPDGVSSVVGGGLRPDAAAALSAMVGASREAGIGDMAIESAYRSYGTQVSTHDEQVASSGEAAADATSARAGYSEHQTGLAADLVACDGGCGSMDDFGASPQGQWVAANGWQWGWIVRYESGTTGITGYDAEPWHLRYIGPELAALYHAGGFHTLEEFWGLPAAPTY